MILVISACAAASEAQAAGDEATVVLTPKPSPRPRINGAMIFGVRPGHPLLLHHCGHRQAADAVRRRGTARRLDA